MKDITTYTYRSIPRGVIKNKVVLTTEQKERAAKNWSEHIKKMRLL